MIGKFSVSGKGLHSGSPCTVTLTLHKDLPYHVFHTPEGDIPALVSSICSNARLATDLACGKAKIRTVEHLLFALSAFQERAEIVVEGQEIPALDGSAQIWMTLLTDAGATPGVKFIPLFAPIRIVQGTSIAEAIPLRDAEQPEYVAEIDFNGAPVGPGRIAFRPFEDSMASLAPARTFALQSQLDDIRSTGFGAGGGLDNALIIGTNGPLNKEGMRLPDEPVRHKLLDAIGDLSLLGGLPRAQLKLVRPGHRLLHALARAIVKTAASPDSQSTVL